MIPVEPDTLTCALHGVSFPALPDALARAARRNGASAAVLAALRALPERPYEGPNQVCMAVYGRFGDGATGP